MMYTIKKYANGRFYDTVAKNYITRPQISALLKKRKKIEIIDTKSGKNITKDIAAKIKAKAPQKAMAKPKAKAKKATGGILVQLFRRGGDTLSDYGKKYASMWQEFLTMSRDEIDKFVNMLVKDNKISEFEAKKLKKEILRYRENIQNWVTKNIDQRINDVLSRINLANRDQILRLTKKIDVLNKKIKTLEGKKRTAKSKR